METKEKSVTKASNVPDSETLITNRNDIMNSKGMKKCERQENTK